MIVCIFPTLYVSLFYTFSKGHVSPLCVSSSLTIQLLYYTIELQNVDRLGGMVLVGEWKTPTITFSIFPLFYQAKTMVLTILHPPPFSPNQTDNKEHFLLLLDFCFVQFKDRKYIFFSCHVCLVKRMENQKDKEHISFIPLLLKVKEQKKLDSFVLFFVMSFSLIISNQFLSCASHGFNFKIIYKSQKKTRF